MGQSVVDDLTNAPQAEVLGEVKVKAPAMQAWTDPDTLTQVALEEGPPPWETAGGPLSGDARQFLDCPQDWVLYWINPKLLDAEGWRGWQHVRAKDERVKVHVPSMVSPEGMLRRGGPTGDILAYMPRHWYESRKKDYQKQVALKTQSSVDRLDNLREQMNRGTFGNGQVQMHLDAKHPTHTMADLTGAND